MAQEKVLFNTFFVYNSQNDSNVTGDDTEKYDVYYRVHAQSYGWLNWAKDGEYAGIAGLSRRLEAIQIVIVKADTGEPGKVNGISSVSKLAYVHTTHSWNCGKVTKEPESYTKNGIKTYTCTECGETKTEQILKSFPVDVSYRTQVQTYGWQKTVKNGQIAGTMGQSKRMETMAISVKDLAGETVILESVTMRMCSLSVGREMSMILQPGKRTEKMPEL